MTRIEQVTRQYQEARQEAARIREVYLEAATAETPDATRVKELKDQMASALADAKRLSDLLEEVRQVDDLNNVQIIRSDISPGRTTSRPSNPSRSADDESNMPTVEDLRNRSEVLNRHFAGETLTDEELALRHTIFPVERLFQKLVRQIVRPGTARMNDADQARWDEYCEISQRAIGDALGAGTASHGADYVPEFLGRQIHSRAELSGGMSSDDHMAVIRMPEPKSQFTFPLAVDEHSKTFETVQENRDGNPDQPETGALALTPEKLSYMVPVSWELLNTNWVDFEAWMVRLTGDALGRTKNMLRTTGAGGATGGTGIVNGANAAGNGTKTGAVNTGVTVDNLTAFFKTVDAAYFSRPGFFAQMHGDIELDMMADVSGGNRTFLVNPADGKLRLPRGADYMLNNALGNKIANGSKIMAIGDLGQYGVVYGNNGIMRIDSEYQMIGDQYLLAWRVHHNSAPLFAADFKRLYVSA